MHAPAPTPDAQHDGEGTRAYRLRALVILALIHTCASIDRTVFSVVLEPIKQEFALSDSQLGFLSGLAFGLAFTLAVLPMGWLADRTRRVRLLAGLLTLWSACTSLGAAVQSYNALLFSRMGVGATESGASPACISLLSDIFPSRQRATVIGIYNGCAALGLLLAFGVGGYLAQRFGWRAALLIAGLPGFLLALAMLAGIREPVRRGGPAGAGNMSPKEVVDFIRGHASLRHLMTGVMLAACVSGGVVSWLASFLVRVHDMQGKEAGVAIALTLGVFGTSGAFFGGWWADRGEAGGSVARRARIAATSIGLTLPLGLMFLYASSAPVMLGALAVWGTCMMMYSGPAVGLIMSIVPGAMRGMTMATLLILSTLVGAGMGPTAVGMLSDLLGSGTALREALAWWLLTGLWAAWHFHRATRHAQTDLEQTARLASA